jgi:thiol:disulfide interchange protein DsbC
VRTLLALLLTALSAHAAEPKVILEEKFDAELSKDWFWGLGTWGAKDGVLRGFESGARRHGPVKMHKLPLKDAIAIKQGKGTRKMAVFVDPNCGYCKRFERDVANLKDVTVYIYLYPILGADSQTKSRDIWCAKDPVLAWRDWMLEDKLPPDARADCDAQALQRNVAFGRKHRVNGTPALFFEDGSRKPGALPAEQVERQLAMAAKKG